MRWLVPKSDEIHAKATKLWTPKTGDWLIEHSKFVSWTEGSHSLLWLNGIRKSCPCLLRRIPLIEQLNRSWIWQDCIDVCIVCALDVLN